MVKNESPDVVSIVTPVFNTGKYLKECIESVIFQTYTKWELILINDCSSDDSQKIIDAYSKKDSRIIGIHNEVNLGSGETRNAGIKLAKGRFLCFLDSDDRWVPSKLEKQLQFLKSKDLPFTFSSYNFIDTQGNQVKSAKVVTTQAIDYNFLLKRTEIFTSTVMIDLNKTGKFYMPPHRRKQDYGLWLSILKAGFKAFGMVDVLADYRLREDSATSKKWNLIWKHVLFLRETQGLSWRKSILFTGYWALNGFIKYYLK